MRFNAPPALPGSQSSDSPLDRALTLMLAGEREAALRWSAAVVQQDASVPSALILTCRLLADAGRQEAAIEGFTLGVERAIDAGNLPLTGPALLSKATQIVHEARPLFDGAEESEPPLIAPLPLFSQLEKEGLRALI